MPLIFNDTLEVTSGSGQYTLQYDNGGSWTGLHTVSGLTDGAIDVNSTANTIELDTSVLLSGTTYQFRWVDGNGTISNIRSLTVTGSITLSTSIGIDTDGFPQIELGIDVIGGSSSYTLTLTNPAGPQTMPVGSATLSSLGVTDPQNFAIVVPFPIRGSDYGATFTFQMEDAVSSLISSVVPVTQPPLNSDPSKTLSLSVASTGVDINVTAPVSGGSGEYRLEIRDSTNNPITDQDFTDVTNGTISQSFTLVSLGLTAGQTYTFILFDTAQLVSNTVTIPV